MIVGAGGKGIGCATGLVAIKRIFALAGVGGSGGGGHRIGGGVGLVMVAFLGF